MLTCSFLISISILFIVIEIMSRFDNRFLLFGSTNLLLCTFCAIDIWIQPGNVDIGWTKAQHFLASFFPAMILWSAMLIFRKVNMQLIRVLFIAGGIFAVSFCTN